MAEERWGSFSVRDHLDLDGLVANVLLYDRLIIPYPPDPAETARWQANGWDPRLLHRRLGELEDLAVRKPWNAHREELFRDRMRELAALDYDAKHATLPYEVSRMILAQEPLSLPPGTTHVDAVLAYNSEASLRRDFVLEQAGHAAATALLLGQRLAVPAGADRERALRQAIELSRDPDFREKRRELYRWQREVMSMGMPPEAALERMDQLVARYNERVSDAVKQVRYKLAFTVGNAVLAVVDTLLGSPLAAANGLLAVVSFAALDRQPAVQPTEAKPAAMFHEMKSIVEWKAAAGA